MSFLLTKALVPALLLSAKFALADGTCEQRDNVKLTFFGLGSAGTITKFGCTGNQETSGSETATAADAPHPRGGMFGLYLSEEHDADATCR